MKLLVKANRDGRDIVGVTPQQAGWRYVGFSAHRLDDATGLDFETGEREVCIVVLSGFVSVRAGADHWQRIGERTSVFEDKAPYALYLPAGLKVDIEAHGVAEVAVCSAPSGEALPARLITPDQMPRTQRGSGSNMRYVCDILPATSPAAHLLVVEVRTPAGHSSSYPPHKHDDDCIPAESVLEETYFHKVDPPQGFALQRVYTDDRSLDETMSAEDGDLVMVPRGYHPVVMPHGYQGYYLNVMAGPTRAWHFRNDPAHEWMLAPRA